MNSATHTSLVLVAAALVGIAACEEKEPPKVPTSANKPTMPGPSSPKAAPSSAAAPAPSTTPTTTPAASNATSISVGDFTFRIPAGWKSIPPSNTMRLAEMQVPDASGDAAKACVVAFSSAGGDVQANIDRWSGQVHDASDQPVKPQVEKKTVAGVPVTIAELTGKYLGMGGGPALENWTMRGVIIETGGSLLFIKMTGPAEQMKATAPAFAALIDGMAKQ